MDYSFSTFGFRSDVGFRIYKDFSFLLDAFFPELDDYFFTVSYLPPHSTDEAFTREDEIFIQASATYYDMAHELCHLLQNIGAIPTSNKSSVLEKKNEIYCLARCSELLTRKDVTYFQLNKYIDIESNKDVIRGLAISSINNGGRDFVKRFETSLKEVLTHE